MKSSFSIQPHETPRSKLLSLIRSDGLVVMTAPDDDSGHRRLDKALQELDACRGAWVNLSSGYLPDWGHRLETLLEKVRHNDWTLSPGAYLSQHHTVQQISKGIPLKDLPEIYHLFGGLKEYSCLVNFMFFDREALDLVEDLVPPSGNSLNLDRFIRQNCDHVGRVRSMTHRHWEAVMHWSPETRTPLPPKAFHIGSSGTFALPDQKVFIVRGDLSRLLPDTRYRGTAVLQTHCMRSYENLRDEILQTSQSAA